MKPTIPAALMERRAVEVGKQRAAAAKLEALAALRDDIAHRMSLLEAAHDAAEAAVDDIDAEVSRLLATYPGAFVSGGRADLDTDKRGRLCLCMADGDSLLVEEG